METLQQRGFATHGEIEDYIRMRFENVWGPSDLRYIRGSKWRRKWQNMVAWAKVSLGRKGMIVNRDCVTVLLARSKNHARIQAWAKSKRRQPIPPIPEHQIDDTRKVSRLADVQKQKVAGGR